MLNHLFERVDRVLPLSCPVVLQRFSPRLLVRVGCICTIRNYEETLFIRCQLHWRLDDSYKIIRSPLGI